MFLFLLNSYVCLFLLSNNPTQAPKTLLRIVRYVDTNPTNHPKPQQKTHDGKENHRPIQGDDDLDVTPSSDWPAVLRTRTTTRFRGIERFQNAASGVAVSRRECRRFFIMFSPHYIYIASDAIYLFLPITYPPRDSAIYSTSEEESHGGFGSGEESKLLMTQQ